MKYWVSLIYLTFVLIIGKLFYISNLFSFKFRNKIQSPFLLKLLEMIAIIFWVRYSMACFWAKLRIKMLLLSVLSILWLLWRQILIYKLLYGAISTKPSFILNKNRTNHPRNVAFYLTQYPANLPSFLYAFLPESKFPEFSSVPDGRKTTPAHISEKPENYDLWLFEPNISSGIVPASSINIIYRLVMI